MKNTHSMAVITTKIIPLVLQRRGGGAVILYIMEVFQLKRNAAAK